MPDFQSKISNFVKNESQSFIQKNINKLAGSLSGMGGGVINSLVGSVSSGLSQNLFEIGNAFNTIEAVAAQKMDSVVAGGAPEFASGGKCSDRASAADISSMRHSSGSLKDYKMNVFPDTVIEEKNKWNENDMIVLAEASTQYFFKMRFYNYQRTDLFKPAKNKSLYTVQLPLPLELVDAQRAEYDTASMKTVGNLMNNGTSKGTIFGGALMAGESAVTGAKNIMKGVAGAIPGVGGIASAAAGAADTVASDSGINAQNIINAIEQYMGVSPNPNPSVLFQGPSLREFNFSWMFNPQSPHESMRIRTAIRKMKSSALPATVFGTDTGLLKYPHVVMINFFPWDNSSDVSSGGYGWADNSFMRIKRCVISNISTNYAPTGAPSFFEGTQDPTFIQLSITFKEIEFFIASDWDSSNSNKGINDFSIEDKKLDSLITGGLKEVKDFIGSIT